MDVMVVTLVERCICVICMIFSSIFFNNSTQNGAQKQSSYLLYSHRDSSSILKETQFYTLAYNVVLSFSIL